MRCPRSCDEALCEYVTSVGSHQYSICHSSTDFSSEGLIQDSRIRDNIPNYEDSQRESGMMSLANTNSWPASIEDQTWPEGGTKYSYENRYIKVEKLKLWLDKAFGPGVAKYAVGPPFPITD